MKALRFLKDRCSFALVGVLALCVLLAVAQPALADGIIIIDPPVPEVPPYLAVKYHRVRVTIEDQVATTHVDQVFVNESGYQLEGVYMFPLPEGATINDFSMWVDGERLSGEVLPAEQARHIYEDIVRRQRDPALLEYVGRNVFRASIFPIPPQAEKRVEIEYTEVLPLDNGLVHYRYPLDTERFSPKPIGDVSVHVEVHSREAIKAVYSPSHDVDVDRRGDYNVTIGYEDADVLPNTDFQLYYSVAEEDIGLNLLSYAGSGDEGGFFLMLLAPRVEVDSTAVVAKDVLLVLDTSGSMRGEKLDQAKRALGFVLNQLNEGDRFSVVSFSTGVHLFAESLADLSKREDALRWVEALEAKGGTDINRAMLEALVQVDDTGQDRPAIIVFLTDGLATEGEVDTDRILANIEGAAPQGVRIFSFGVGDDVNTLLLDRMASDHRGTSAYVRPGQSIEEDVSAFYAKVSTPLLSDVQIDFGSVQVEDAYPYPLPDVFAGTQIVMVGRYREGGATTVTLRGTVNGQEKVYRFGDVSFQTEIRAGEGKFIPRLWAMRKVGYLLNQIRLHGESKELVEEIVDLSVRYGIMTPYTSFLVNEDSEVFTPEGRDRAAEREYSVMATATPASPVGKQAVDEAEGKTALERSDTATGATGDVVKIVGDKAFLLREGVWTDTTYDPDRMTPLKVGFMSDAYLGLIAARPEWAAYLAIGERVLVVLDSGDGKGPVAYLVVGPDEGEQIDLPAPATPTATVRVAVTPTRDPGKTPSPQVTPAGTDPATERPAQSLCRGALAALLVSALAALLMARRR
jgi:Ca-activated chloride channel family protein